MTPLWLLVLLCSPLCQPVSVESWGVSTVPSESECRPYIEKALKERSPQEAVDTTGSEQVPSLSSSDDQEGSTEETEESNIKESKEEETDNEVHRKDDDVSSETGEFTDTKVIEEDEDIQGAAQGDNENSGETYEKEIDADPKTNESIEETEEENGNITTDQPSVEDGSESVETGDNTTQPEQTSTEENEDDATAEEQSTETPDEATTDERSAEEETKSEEETTDDDAKQESGEEAATEESHENNEDEAGEESVEKVDISEEAILSSEDQGGEESIEVPGGEATDSDEINESLEVIKSSETIPNKDLNVNEQETKEELIEDNTNTKQDDSVEESSGTTDMSAEEPNEKKALSEEELEALTEEETESPTEEETEAITEEGTEAPTSIEEKSETQENSLHVNEEPSEETTESSEASADVSIAEKVEESLEDNNTNGTVTNDGDEDNKDGPLSKEESSDTSQEQENAEEITQEQEPTIEDQLTLEFEAPKVRRPRDHITEILHLNPEAAESELMLAKTIESTLKDLKKLYDVAIKPLEILFKYRDLSNRHFGDPEIFSKPLILFMGPWSGGKSTILNYLLDNEFKSSSLRTGAEPSPAYFNILMWGEREEVLEGTQLAADWTFSGLQKFGQGLLDRLRGLKLNSPILEKVNIVEIPGILEIRKQVERLFPFNDACQWFIDRADIIFLVYDPSKLDVGPETEAILDQLKGREYQTRIILNKADQVKPEELMRVQGTLIWNISPLMSSTEPPVMYSTSLWSLPYEQGAPSRLLHAQERAFLRDLRQAIDKRVENKIASARRFAVRVRNHAKMVDCYLTTYYNHKSFFGNKKKVADDIIEQPQNYHIYEGLSTLTNISRYDLPDPEVYRDFFRLNPLYDFQRLSETCTYFRGCPINRLDVAIAYDLPELVGKYKKQAEKVLETVAEKQATKS